MYDKVINEKILCMPALQIQKEKSLCYAKKTSSVLRGATPNFSWETSHIRVDYMCTHTISCGKKSVSNQSSDAGVIGDVQLFY